jgi:hypothetical protein
MQYVTFLLSFFQFPPMKTINFGKYLRLFKIEPIKTIEFRFILIRKMRSNMLHTVLAKIRLQKVFTFHTLPEAELIKFESVLKNFNFYYFKFNILVFISQNLKNI